MREIVIASRDSLLARAQTKMLVDYIKKASPDIDIRLMTLKTTGDKLLDRPLDEVGGKGLFVKELDLALREGRADITVHSLKDVPYLVPPDLPIIGYSRREDARDVLVLPKGINAPDPKLPIGSSSLRRRIQLERLYPDYKMESIRGNIDTRLRKLDDGRYGALVLAAAGLIRLGLEERISYYFPIEDMVPAAGQGIIALQGRMGEDYSFLSGFIDDDATKAAICERAFTEALGCNCTSPVGAYAYIKNDYIELTGMYYNDNATKYIVGRHIGEACDAASIGRELAERLSVTPIKGES